MEKQKKIKVALIIALWISCLFDLFTFLSGKLFQFETNPLFLFTGNIVFLVLFKLVVNAGLTWMLLCYKPKKTFKYAFLFVLVVLYAFLGQSWGGYTNMDASTQYEVTVGTPQEIQPMEQTQAVRTFAYAALIIMYLPMLMAFIAFWIFEKIYLV